MSTLFQIDFEVIRTMRSENFSFSFAENVGKFMILGGNCYGLKSLELGNRITLVLSNTRELDRELFYKLVYLI